MMGRAPPHRGQWSKTCFNYVHGACKWGKDCMYYHDPSLGLPDAHRWLAQEEVRKESKMCQYFRPGRDKYHACLRGPLCTFIHQGERYWEMQRAQSREAAPEPEPELELELREDPSDGVRYSYASFVEVYKERAPSCWEEAGRRMRQAEEMARDAAKPADGIRSGELFSVLDDKARLDNAGKGRADAGSTDGGDAALSVDQSAAADSNPITDPSEPGEKFGYPRRATLSRSGGSVGNPMGELDVKHPLYPLPEGWVNDECVRTPNSVSYPEWPKSSPDCTRYFRTVEQHIRAELCSAVSAKRSADSHRQKNRKAAPTGQVCRVLTADKSSFVIYISLEDDTEDLESDQVGFTKNQHLLRVESEWRAQFYLVQKDTAIFKEKSGQPSQEKEVVGYHVQLIQQADRILEPDMEVFVEDFGFIGDEVASWNAVQKLRQRSKIGEMPLTLAVSMCQSQPTDENFQDSYSLDLDCNEDQRASLDGLSGNLNVIQGPPGTGKTRLIAEILTHKLPDNTTATVVSKDNEAIDNLCAHLLRPPSDRTSRESALTPAQQVSFRLSQTNLQRSVSGAPEPAPDSDAGWLVGSKMPSYVVLSKPQNLHNRNATNLLKLLVPQYSRWQTYREQGPRSEGDFLHNEKDIAYMLQWPQAWQRGGETVGRVGDADSQGSIDILDTHFGVEVVCRQRKLLTDGQWNEYSLENTVKCVIDETIRSCKAFICTVGSIDRMNEYHGDEIPGYAYGCMNGRTKLSNALSLSAVPPHNVRTIIVDEASRVTETAIPRLLTVQLDAPRELEDQNTSKSLILVGDHKQLAPFTQCDHGKEPWQDTQRRIAEGSLMRRFMSVHKDAPMLREQYRMHPEVCKVVSDLIYEGELYTNDTVAAKRYTAQRYHNAGDIHPVAPITFHNCDGIDFRGDEESSGKSGKSYINRREAKKIKEYYSELREQQGSNRGANGTVMVITFYKTQKELLEKYLKLTSDDRSRLEKKVADLQAHASSLYEDESSSSDLEVARIDHQLAEAQAKLYNDEHLKICTVDGSQGHEADVVIVSCVRSNTKAEIGFLTVRSRLNVSLSRGKEEVHLFGSAQTLWAGDEDYSDWCTLLERTVTIKKDHTDRLTADDAAADAREHARTAKANVNYRRDRLRAQEATSFATAAAEAGYTQTIDQRCIGRVVYKTSETWHSKTWGKLYITAIPRGHPSLNAVVAAPAARKVAYMEQMACVPGEWDKISEHDEVEFTLHDQGAEQEAKRWKAVDVRVLRDKYPKLFVESLRSMMLGASEREREPEPEPEPEPELQPTTAANPYDVLREVDSDDEDDQSDEEQDKSTGASSAEDSSSITQLKSLKDTARHAAEPEPDSSAAEKKRAKKARQKARKAEEKAAQTAAEETAAAAKAAEEAEAARIAEEAAAAIKLVEHAAKAARIAEEQRFAKAAVGSRVPMVMFPGSTEDADGKVTKDRSARLVEESEEIDRITNNLPGKLVIQQYTRSGLVELLPHGATFKQIPTVFLPLNQKCQADDLAVLHKANEGAAWTVLKVAIEVREGGLVASFQLETFCFIKAVMKKFAAACVSRRQHIVDHQHRTRASNMDVEGDVSKLKHESDISDLLGYIKLSGCSERIKEEYPGLRIEDVVNMTTQELMDLCDTGKMRNYERGRFMRIVEDLKRRSMSAGLECVLDTRSADLAVFVNDREISPDSRPFTLEICAFSSPQSVAVRTDATTRGFTEVASKPLIDLPCPCKATVALTVPKGFDFAPRQRANPRVDTFEWKLDGNGIVQFVLICLADARTGLTEPFTAEVSAGGNSYGTCTFQLTVHEQGSDAGSAPDSPTGSIDTELVTNEAGWRSRWLEKERERRELVQPHKAWAYFSDMNGDEKTKIKLQTENQGVKDVAKDVVGNRMAIDHNTSPSYQAHLKDQRNIMKRDNVQLVHFAGHSNTEAGEDVAFFWTDGSPLIATVLASDLKEYFRGSALGGTIDCVVLNVCTSLRCAPSLIAEGCPIVICWSDIIEDSIAIDFAVALFGALANDNENYAYAFHWACDAVKERLWSSDRTHTAYPCLVWGANICHLRCCDAIKRKWLDTADLLDETESVRYQYCYSPPIRTDTERLISDVRDVLVDYERVPQSSEDRMRQLSSSLAEQIAQDANTEIGRGSTSELSAKYAGAVVITCPALANAAKKGTPVKQGSTAAGELLEEAHAGCTGLRVKVSRGCFMQTDEIELGEAPTSQTITPAAICSDWNAFVDLVNKDKAVCVWSTYFDCNPGPSHDFWFQCDADAASTFPTMRNILNGRSAPVWVVLHVHYRGVLYDRETGLRWEPRCLPDVVEWRASSTAGNAASNDDIFNSIQSANLRFGIDVAREAKLNKDAIGDFDGSITKVDGIPRIFELRLDRTDIQSFKPAATLRAVRRLLEHMAAQGCAVTDMQNNADERNIGGKWRIQLDSALATDIPAGTVVTQAGSSGRGTLQQLAKAGCNNLVVTPTADGFLPTGAIKVGSETLNVGQPVIQFTKRCQCVAADGTSVKFAVYMKDETGTFTSVSERSLHKILYQQVYAPQPPNAKYEEFVEFNSAVDETTLASVYAKHLDVKQIGEPPIACFHGKGPSSSMRLTPFIEKTLPSPIDESKKCFNRDMARPANGAMDPLWLWRNTDLVDTSNGPCKYPDLRQSTDDNSTQAITVPILSDAIDLSMVMRKGWELRSSSERNEGGSGQTGHRGLNRPNGQAEKKAMEALGFTISEQFGSTKNYAKLFARDGPIVQRASSDDVTMEQRQKCIFQLGIAIDLRDTGIDDSFGNHRTHKKHIEVLSSMKACKEAIEKVVLEDSSTQTARDRLPVAEPEPEPETEVE